MLTSDGISSNKMEPVLRIRKRKDAFSGLVIVHAEMLIFAANIEEKIAELWLCYNYKELEIKLGLCYEL